MSFAGGMMNSLASSALAPQPGASPYGSPYGQSPYGAAPYGAQPGNPYVNAMKNRVLSVVAPQAGYGTALGPNGQPRPPGYEPPTPVPLPEDSADTNQGAIIAAILGGSALLGIIAGCALFRNKGGPHGDSDSDADSDDDSDESGSD